jgi:hypothetical protein
MDKKSNFKEIIGKWIYTAYIFTKVFKIGTDIL